MKNTCVTRSLLSFLLVFVFTLVPTSTLLGQPQQNYSRVRAARAEKQELIEQLFVSKGLSYPPNLIFLRIFKQEGELELWARRLEGEAFVLVKTYEICQSSGRLGPKRRQGDLQVPEGFYKVTNFNPTSSFYLSFQIDYPNRSDRILGQQPLGGEIFIHGSCVTIGCIPITDQYIKELYLIALDVHSAGKTVPVHIFPTRMTTERMAELKRDDPDLGPFWNNLKQGFDYFEAGKKLPGVSVAKDGTYLFK